MSRIADHPAEPLFVDRWAPRSVPDGFATEAMVAFGRRADLNRLPADFHAQESPNGRRPLAEPVFAGRFGAAAFIEKRNAA